MAEPTLALSFYDLILRVAKETGMAYYGSTGQTAAVIPYTPYELDQCKQIVLDGIRMFIADAPLNGWRWMRRTASVTFDIDGTGADNIDSDPARYLLPEHFGGSADGPPTYAADSSRGVPLTWVDESFIRNRRDPNVITSHPMYLAIRPYQPESAPSLSSARRFELLVDPSPSSADTIEFPYTVYFNNMQLEAGLATGGSSTTLVDSARTEANDYFNGWVITVVAGTGIHETATVTDYVKATGTFTFTALSGGSTPDTTSVYIVQPSANLHPAGFRFDQAIQTATLAQAELQITEFAKGYMALYSEKDLPMAQRIDARSAPRTLGNYVERRGRGQERTWDDITTDHDV